MIPLRAPSAAPEFRASQSIERKRRDRVHDALTESQVNFPSGRLEIGSCKIDWFAYDDGNGTKAHSPTPAWQRFARAENPHRHNGRERFCDYEPQAGQGRSQAAVEGALALGKHQGPLSGFQDPNQRFQSNAIVPFLIDGNDIQFRQKPAEERPGQKCLAREKKNCAIGNAADERWVEITLVVRCQNDRTVIDHALAMDDAKPEKNPADQFDEMIAEPVVRVQNN